MAQYLSVPVTWVYKRTRKEGPETIPHIKLGKYVRFDPESSAFQRWLDSHKVACGEDDALTLKSTVNRVRATEETGQVDERRTDGP